MEILIGILFLIGVHYWTSPERKANNYIPPDGMKTDYSKANADIVLKGKDYYYKKMASGGYNIPDPYYKKKNNDNKPNK